MVSENKVNDKSKQIKVENKFTNKISLNGDSRVCCWRCCLRKSAAKCCTFSAKSCQQQPLLSRCCWRQTIGLQEPEAATTADNNNNEQHQISAAIRRSSREEWNAINSARISSSRRAVGEAGQASYLIIKPSVPNSSASTSQSVSAANYKFKSKFESKSSIATGRATTTCCCSAATLCATSKGRPFTLSSGFKAKRGRRRTDAKIKRRRRQVEEGAAQIVGGKHDLKSSAGHYSHQFQANSSTFSGLSVSRRRRPAICRSTLVTNHQAPLFTLILLHCALSLALLELASGEVRRLPRSHQERSTYDTATDSSVTGNNRRLVIENSRVLRQISAHTWRNGQTGGPAQSASGISNVPYKTFYVTRACEWKSNLFVPKSNDIHFAQSSPPVLANNGHQSPLAQSQSNDQSLASRATSGGGGVESSVVYETFNTNANNNNNYLQQQNSRTIQAQQLQQQQQDGSRTMLSTDSKALILALPITMSQSFAGYEPACSIRLIVPRNMRILAKLTSRRLTFAQQQTGSNTDNLDGSANHLDQSQQERSLWLNVSQNQFIETEHKTIETEGNVLAFRFLLERFANKQVPDTRFQVVLTAFQTLSENSDLSGASQQQQPAVGNQPSMEPNAQFICDQQRLISANLACDGFKNCQDGQDEEMATCLAWRHQNYNNNNNPTNQIPDFTGTSTPSSDLVNRNQQFSVPVGEPTSGGVGQSNQSGKSAQDQRSVWVRFWNYLAPDTNSLAGFLLGFLMVLLLLTCCCCCSYLALLVWRHQRHRYQQTRREQLSDEQEADALAAQNNTDNAARLKQRSMLAEGGVAGRSTASAGGQQQQPPPRLQSILKKPGLLLTPEYEPAAGRARPFGARTRPAEPPPAAPPLRPARSSGPQVAGGYAHGAGQKRGALSSSLQQPGIGQQRTSDFKPTPAKRLTRPTRPVPIPVQVQQPRPQQSDPETTRSRPTPPGAVRATTSSSSSLPSSAGQAQRHLGVASSGHSKSTTTTATGSQRVTIYHYSSGTTHLSESYIQRLAAEQSSSTVASPSASTTADSSAGAAVPPGGDNVNYPQQREPSVSPQSSLI